MAWVILTRRMVDGETMMMPRRAHFLRLDGGRNVAGKKVSDAAELPGAAEACDVERPICSYGLDSYGRMAMAYVVMAT